MELSSFSYGVPGRVRWLLGFSLAEMKHSVVGPLKTLRRQSFGSVEYFPPNTTQVLASRTSTVPVQYNNISAIHFRDKMIFQDPFCHDS